jgi:riboflavin kinase/FMN adenylyltransferase
MRLFTQLEQITEPFKQAVITIGNFDGVHLGHQALFHEVIEKAASINGTSIAMTFEPHPLRVLRENNHLPLITLYEQKVELIERAGMDVLICIPFTREFANLGAREFVQNLLLERIGMRAIVVGEDYSFGRNREGDIELLKTFGESLGFEVIVANWIKSAKAGVNRISSTRIRELVTEGKMRQAGKLLGRHYQIRGNVVTGRDRGGKLLGIPTANIKLRDELCPKTGIYAVTVDLENLQYPGVANIGYSPTFDDHVFTVEVHILDFNRNIYEKDIRVNFIERIRDEKRFDSIEELKSQIQEDILEARRILTNHL